MILEVKNLNFNLEKKAILKNLNFSLKEGAYLTIIGPNGAGKSSLIKTIARIYHHQSGDIYIKGKNIKTYSQKNLAKIISYVPQAGGWIPPFTVGDFLKLSRYPHLNGSFLLKKEDKEAINLSLNLTGLESFKNRSLRTLSGGERQKAFVAAALAQEARLILLDEPASFLDPKHAAELNKLLKTLNQKNNLSMITITHELNHPLFLNGNILVLQKGSQLFYGSPQELLKNNILEKAYQHEFIYFKHPISGKTGILAE